MPAYYLIVIALIGLYTGIRMPETANKPLRGATPAASDKAEAKKFLASTLTILSRKLKILTNKLLSLKKRQSLINQHPKLD